jgi:hypothetical protein
MLLAPHALISRHLLTRAINVAYLGLGHQRLPRAPPATIT